MEISVTVSPVTQTTIVTPSTSSVLTEINSDSRSVTSNTALNITEVSTLTSNADLANYLLKSQTGDFSDLGYVSGISGDISARLQTTGATLLNLIQVSNAGVSSLNGVSGTITLAGAGNVSVSTVGQSITVSGNTGIYSTFITTGQTGAFATSVNTGSLLAASTFTGFTGGILKIVTTLTSGVQFQTISYPVTLPSNPIVICDFENDVDGFIYNHAIYNVNTSGFNVGFSDILSNSGYRLYSTVNVV